MARVRTLSMLAAFGVAMWALSAAWAALRGVWFHRTPAGAALTAAYAVILVGTLLYLGYWLYAADRAAGRVRRPIGLYERLLRRRDNA